MLIMATNYLMPSRGIAVQLVGGNIVIHGITIESM